MSMQQQIRDAVLAHGAGATTKDIARALGLPAQKVSVSLSNMWTHGHMTRVVVGHSITNQPRYGYTAVEKKNNVTPQKNNATPQKNDAAPQKQVQSSLTGLIDQMSRALANQIASGIGAHLMVELSKMAPDASTRVALPTAQELIARVQLALPAPAGKKLTKVVIVGMNPKQAGAIQNQFHDTLHIDYWNDKDGHSLEMLKQFSRRAERVFFNLSNCSHTSVEMAHSVGAAITRVSGGTTAMVDALTKFYVEEVTV